MKKSEWQVYFDDEGMSIVRLKEDMPTKVFVEKAWGKMIIDTADGSSGEYSFIFHSEVGLDRAGENVDSLVFQHKPFQSISVKIGNDTLGLNKIRLLSFYAFMDIGVLMVSFCPFFSDMARPLIIEYEGKGKNIPHLHHSAVAWYFEIVGKVAN